jgi:hypothetical protein
VAVLAVEAAMQQKLFGLFVSPLSPGDWFHMDDSSGRVLYNQLIALPVWLELLLVGGLQCDPPAAVVLGATAAHPQVRLQWCCMADVTVTCAAAAGWALRAMFQGSMLLAQPPSHCMPPPHHKLNTASCC